MSGWTSLNDDRETRFLAEVLLPFATIVAIGVGGIVAIYKLQVFRDFEPHLSISQEVEHRFIGDSYIHIAVIVDLQNNSKVEIEIRQGVFRLQHIAPASDEEVEDLYAQVFHTMECDDIQWPIIVEHWRNWDRNVFLIEPGESHQEIVEFIVTIEVESTLIYTYFYNSRFSQGSRSAEGWGATTVHDIIK